MSIVIKRQIDEDATWYGGRPRPRRHCVRWGPNSPPKKDTALQFSAHVYCSQTAVCIRIPLGTEVGLSLGGIVLAGPSSPSSEGAQPLQFSANVCCGQTAGRTKMPLGTEVGLGRGDFVFDGDPSNFWPLSIVAKQLDGSRCHLVLR